MIETENRPRTTGDVHFDAFLLGMQAECGEDCRRYKPLEFARLAFEAGKRCVDHSLGAESFRDGFCFGGILGVLAGLILAAFASAVFNWLKA